MERPTPPKRDNIYYQKMASQIVEGVRAEASQALNYFGERTFLPKDVARRLQEFLTNTHLIFPFSEEEPAWNKLQQTRSDLRAYDPRLVVLYASPVSETNDAEIQPPLLPGIYIDGQSLAKNLQSGDGTLFTERYWFHESLLQQLPKAVSPIREIFPDVSYFETVRDKLPEDLKNLENLRILTRGFSYVVLTPDGNLFPVFLTPGISIPIEEETRMIIFSTFLKIMYYGFVITERVLTENYMQKYGLKKEKAIDKAKSDIESQFMPQNILQNGLSILLNNSRSLPEMYQNEKTVLNALKLTEDTSPGHLEEISRRWIDLLSFKDYHQFLKLATQEENNMFNKVVDSLRAGFDLSSSSFKPPNIVVI
jgi:hypothetical protein